MVGISSETWSVDLKRVLYVQAHMEAVHADWKQYLNLLICEENHLKHMDEYHKVRRCWPTKTKIQFVLQFCKSYNLNAGQITWGTLKSRRCVSCLLWKEAVWLIDLLLLQFHKEARDTQDLLKRLETEIHQKYNPEFKDMYQLDGLLTDLGVNTV